MKNLNQLLIFAIALTYSTFFVVLSPNLYAAKKSITTTQCGLFSAYGHIRSVKNKPYLVVNEGSLSEYRLEIPNRPFLALSYKDKFVEIKGQIKTKLLNYDGVLFQNSIKIASADPLGQTRSNNLVLIKKQKCK